MSNKLRYLLDASALLNIISKINLETLLTNDVELFITQLTPFEVGNALWKLSFRNIISEEEANIIVELLNQMINLEALRIIQITNYPDILSVSLRRKITFYDASYIFTASIHKLILVTDDNGLKINAKLEGIEVISSKKLREKHPRLLLEETR